MPQAQAREETMSTEPSGKPDAWKLARPVWGWGRGAIPRPTPRGGAVFVTADTIRWQNAYDFIEEQRAAFAGKEAAA